MSTTTPAGSPSGTSDTNSSSGTTTATSAGSPTTTSTASGTTGSDDEPWSTRTTVTAGGTVVVSYRTDVVVLETAIPLTGFAVEIEEAGPPEVEVEFESAALRVRFDAEWRDVALHIEVDEN